MNTTYEEQILNLKHDLKAAQSENAALRARLEGDKVTDAQLAKAIRHTFNVTTAYEIDIDIAIRLRESINEILVANKVRATI